MEIGWEPDPWRRRRPGSRRVELEGDPRAENYGEGLGAAGGSGGDAPRGGKAASGREGLSEGNRKTEWVAGFGDWVTPISVFTA